MASFWGHKSCVEELQRNGADINCQTSEGFTPLYLASQNGHVHVVDYLLRQGAFVDRPSKIGCIPLIVASGGGHTQVVDLLLRYEANVDHVANDPNKSTALGEAIENGHRYYVRL